MSDKEESSGLGQIVNASIERGITSIVKKHPRFKGYEQFLTSYLDKRKFQECYDKALQKARNYSDPEKQTKAFSDYLANSIATGEIFNESGQEIVLRKSLEEKASGWFFGRKSRDVLKGEKYLDNVLESFRDIYQMLASGDYAQRMPELAQAVAAVYDAGFMDTAANILYQKGLLDETKYHVIKKSIRKRAELGVESTKQAMEKYSTYQQAQKVAASILAILGIGILFASNSITGNVIGQSNTNILSLVSGSLLVLSAIWLFSKSKKFKNKKQ